MTNLTIKRSKRATILYIIFALTVGFVALAIVYGGNLGGWCLMPIAGGFLLAGILGLFDSSPRVIINDSGLVIRALGPEQIPWYRVKSVRGEFLPKAGNMLILELVDGTQHRFYIDVLEIPPYKILELIKERILIKL